MDLEKLRREFRPASLVSPVMAAMENDKIASKEAREFKMRCSGLPSCSILWFVQHQKTLQQPYTPEGQGLAFYASIGTAVHTMMQRWVSHTGKLYGHYVCPHCNHREEFTTEHVCPKCNKDMDYEEISFKYGPLTGHIDTLYKHNKAQYTLVDYKTTSSFALKKLTSSLEMSANYVAQTMTYTWVCNNVLNIPVTRFGLYSQARDSLQSRQEFYRDWTYELNEEVGEFVRQQITGYKAARKASKLYAHGDWDTAFRYLFKYRTCQTPSIYKKLMQPCFKYEANGACPFAEYCFNKHDQKPLKKAIWLAVQQKD